MNPSAVYLYFVCIISLITAIFENVQFRKFLKANELNSEVCNLLLLTIYLHLQRNDDPIIPIAEIRFQS
jgi:hypothetical protein